jgi:hypothetical protein
MQPSCVLVQVSGLKEGMGEIQEVLEGLQEQLEQVRTD